MCVVPSFLRRNEHFFGSGGYCLQYMLDQRPEVQDLLAVKEAYMPVIKLKVNECLLVVNGGGGSGVWCPFTEAAAASNHSLLL